MALRTAVKLPKELTFKGDQHQMSYHFLQLAT